jgi:serine phosphatase RsbU (regulator of sigma subunit)
MRSSCRLSFFLISWVASLAALVGAAFLTRTYALGDDVVGRALAWAVPAAVATIAAWVGAGLATGPCAAAARAARRLAEGDSRARLPESRSGELAALAKIVNTQADALAERSAEGDLAAAERAESLSGALEELRARDEARARDVRMAARMQRRIVPGIEELPARKEMAFGAAYLPAENTGGDLYDATRAGKNGIALLSADVSGRGVTAALIAALVKNAFRSRVGWDADAAVLMGSVNAELFPIISDTDHFVTAFFALLDLETGLVRFVNAGHPPALLYRRRKGAVEELDSGCAPLGVQADASFTAGERRLEEGDRLLFYTDGLTLARDYRGEAFGRERLASAFLDSVARPAAESAGAVAAALESFRIGAPRADDVAVLVCEFLAFARPEDTARRRPPEREDWRILAHRGAELASKGRIEEAVGAYERLLEIEPSDATALNNLGTLYWRLGRREDAATRFKTAATIDPSDPRIQRNLALAQRVASARRFAAARAASNSAPRPEADEPPAPSPAVSDAVAVLGEVSSARVAEAVEEAEAIEDAEPVDEAENAL